MQLPQTSSPELTRLSDELKSLQREIRGREKARSDLLTFVNLIDVPGKSVDEEDDDCDEFLPIESSFAAHHLLWIRCLQAVADGKIKNLLGLMPPGSAKTTYTSVVFPPFVMGRKPGSHIIETSYGSVLPRKSGRKARSIVRQPQYRRVFDTEMSGESQAADDWVLKNGSSFMAAGILAGITGNRGDGIIWDDLIKGREQADSEVIRNKTWEAYEDDLLSRKKPGAWEIGITTRWHADDPAGRILPEDYNGQSGWVKGRDGQDWYVVCLPAIAERADDPLGRAVGERLWPEWFGPDHFDRFMRVPRTWSSLYQQRPAPEEGIYFKRDDLRFYDDVPSPKFAQQRGMHIYGASDYAVTDAGGDYTVHVVAGVDAEDDLYILDLWREQKESDVWVDEFCRLVKKWKPLCWGEPKDQIDKSIGPFLIKRMRELRAYCSRVQFPERGSKPVKARSFQARASMHKVRLPNPANAPWVEKLIAEMLTFPAGANDDQVDALGVLGRMLDQMVAGHPPPPEDSKPKTGYSPLQTINGSGDTASLKV